MRFYNFSIYDEESEMPGGDYWKFLVAPVDDLEQCGIYFYDFMRVWNGLKNEELKMKMKDKLVSIIMQKGFFYNGMMSCLSIFSIDEIKKLELKLTMYDESFSKVIMTTDNIVITLD